VRWGSDSERCTAQIMNLRFLYPPSEIRIMVTTGIPWRCKRWHPTGRYIARRTFVDSPRLGADGWQYLHFLRFSVVCTFPLPLSLSPLINSLFVTSLSWSLPGMLPYFVLPR